MKRKRFLLLVLLPALVFPQGKPRTLEECIEYAIRNNPKRIQQEAQNKIYRFDQVEAAGAFLPSLHVETSAYFRQGRGLDPETNTYINTNTFNNTYDLYSSMTLFDGLSQIYRAKMSKINRLKGKEELRETIDKIAFEVMEIFFNVLYYQGTTALAQQQLEESVNTLKKIRRMEELGLKSFPDLTEIQAKEAEDRLACTRQTNLYSLEIIKLKGKMNFPLEEELLIENQENTLSSSKELESPTAIYRQALGILPQVLVSDNSLRASAMEYKIAQGRLFPVLSVSAGFSTGFARLMDGSHYASFEDQIKNRRGSYLGLSLSIPVFDRLSRFSEVKRSKQRFIIAQSRHEETLRQAYSEIEQAVADVNGLVDECNHAQKRTIAMQNAHQINLRKYEEGLIDALELSTSTNRLLNAQVEELYTNLKYQLKYRLLQYYKGETSWILF